MRRITAFLVVLMMIASVLLLGCGGDKGTSPGPSKNFIKFVNEYLWYEEYMKLHITIEACHQDFYMEPHEVKVVECVCEDGSTSFLVVIETEFHGPLVSHGTYTRWEGTVSGGQTVTITNTLLAMHVDVQG